MNTYFFGLGSGHLGKLAARIAKRHGAVLVNYYDPYCRCGRGCARHCPATARHWFAGPNRGEPYDSELARRVLGDLDAAADLLAVEDEQN